MTRREWVACGLGQAGMGALMCAMLNQTGWGFVCLACAVFDMWYLLATSAPPGPRS